MERSAAQALPDVGRPTSGRAGDACGRFKPCQYASLGRWLNWRLGPGDREISLRFAEIEQIIDAKLPASARARRSFWANDITHSHAKSWLSAGFETTSLSLKNEVVTFRFSRRVLKMNSTTWSLRSWHSAAHRGCPSACRFAGLRPQPQLATVIERPSRACGKD